MDDPVAAADTVAVQVRRLVTAGVSAVRIEIDPAGRPVPFAFLDRLAALRADLAALHLALAVARADPALVSAGSSPGAGDDITHAPHATLREVFAVHQLLEPPPIPARRPRPDAPQASPDGPPTPCSTTPANEIILAPTTLGADDAVTARSRPRRSAGGLTGVERDRVADELAERYHRGESLTRIATATGRSYGGGVRRLLLDRGVQLRRRGGDNRIQRNRPELA